MWLKLLPIVFLAFLSNVYSQELLPLPVRDIKPEELVFGHGENLRYIINYQWGSINTDVGEAVLTLEYNDNAEEPFFHARAVGRTFRFYDVLFKVRDFYETKFSARNLRPFYFHRDIREKKYKMKNTMTFLPNYQIRANIERLDDPPRDTLLNGKIYTFDLLSLFYFARNNDFGNDKVGQERPVSFVIDGEIFDLYYRYLGKENKRIPGLGHYKTIKFAARLVAGEVFSGKEELVFWVTDDKNKIPLLFETPIIVGRVTGRLAGFSNIKYPFPGKIK